MAEQENKGGLPAERQSPVPNSVPLSPSTALDLSYLPEAQRAQLLTEYNRGMLDLSKKAQELHIDVAALRSSLDTLSHTVKETSREGNSITASHTVTSSAGRTEVIMGNTERAATGKLSASQTGEFNWTPIYVIIGIIAAVLVLAQIAK
jgi:hypothetical protein